MRFIRFLMCCLIISLLIFVIFFLSLGWLMLLELLSMQWLRLLFFVLWGGKKMAVSFRHGSNGSYKSAYAVWFEILPALRSGRVVVTNMEGLKPLESIEKILGEKFPSSARLFRIFTRNKEGVSLWQNWFNWMPIGAFVLIDECQDLYCSEADFKREKFLSRPLSDFTETLPNGFSEFFHSKWNPVDLSQLKEGDIDDCERTEYNEDGRILYPFDFYGAFMRHRKYQWDIVMLTPDYTAIPTWLRGCAGEAYSHRSTDTFFRKRKPRIYNHPPKATKTAPTSKSDFASCSSKKIPLETFALYKSTGTGGFNESKSDISMLKSPRFIISIFICFAAIFKFLWDGYALLYGNTENKTETATQVDDSNQKNTTSGFSENVGNNSSNSKNNNGVANGGNINQNISEISIDDINPFYKDFPIYNGADAVYLTSVFINRLNEDFSFRDYLFRIDKGDSSYYLRSEVLLRYGYSFNYIDDCLIQIESGNLKRMLSCPPNDEIRKKNNTPEKSDKIEQVDIFNLASN